MIGTDTIRAKIRPTRMYLYNDLEALGYVPIQSERYARKVPVGEYGPREYASPAYERRAQRPLTQWLGDQL